LRKSIKRKITGKQEIIERIKKEAPEQPGVYQFKNKFGKIIYIGKSINLKNRLLNHFSSLPNYEESRLRMVHEIEDFTFDITRTELEALLLEDFLIKTHLPVYNTRQKEMEENVQVDFSAHEFPLVSQQAFSAEHFDINSFGPYKDKYFAEKLIEILKEEFGIRTCRGSLPEAACSLLGLNRCFGPCIKEISLPDYLKNIEDARHFLHGLNKALQEKLARQMKQFSAEMKFEKAQAVKEKLEFITKYQERQQFLIRFREEKINFSDSDHPDIIYSFEYGNYLVFKKDETRPTKIPDNTGGNLQFISDRGNIVYNYRKNLLIC